MRGAGVAAAVTWGASPQVQTWASRRHEKFLVGSLPPQVLGMGFSPWSTRVRGGGQEVEETGVCWQGGREAPLGGWLVVAAMSLVVSEAPPRSNNSLIFPLM